jgi:3-hydroxybutyryl-CoA dehydratase
MAKIEALIISFQTLLDWFFIISFNQNQVDQYAQISGDTNPLHIDEEAGAASVFWQMHHSWTFKCQYFYKCFGVLLHADGQIYMKQNTTFL